MRSSVRILFTWPLILIVVAVGVLASASPTTADPSFGVNPGGPSGLPGGGVLEPAPGAPVVGPLPAPVVAITPAALGLPAAVTIDDISYGDDMFPPPAPWHLVFSVAAGSVGHPGSPPVGPLPNVTMEGPATPPGDGHVEGDIYSSFVTTGPGGPLGAFAFAGPPPAPCGPIQSNIQSADGNGLPPLFGIPNVGLGLIEPPGFPPPFGDDLDKIDLTDPTTIAPGGAPISPVFFTIDAASVGAMPIVPPNFSPPSAATVYAFVPGFGVADWAPAGALGLAGPGNDIDALMVSYTSGAPIMAPPGWIGGGDVILLSLAPGSPANPGLGSFCFGPGSGLPDDVYVDFAPGGAPPAPAIDAEMLGLNTARSGGFGAPDNLDAMDLCIGSGLDSDGDLIDNACDFDRDGDLIGNAIDNCPDVPNPGQGNNDAPGGPFGGTPPWIVDGVAPEGATTGGDACDANDDNDKCTDVQEPGLIPARDPLNPWDFADMWVPSLPAGGPPPPGGRNGVVLLSDTAAALLWVGTINNAGPNGSGRDYDSDVNLNGVEDGAEYDRTPNGVGLSGPPNGSVLLNDVAVILAQVGDAC